jgi:hypothetical protein
MEGEELPKMYICLQVKGSLVPQVNCNMAQNAGVTFFGGGGRLHRLIALQYK